MGPRSLQTYAKMTYGIDYTEHEVKELSEQWLDLFPEMREFLKDTVNTPLELARDGAKLGPWRVWRNGYKIVNFIHDQILVEVPAADDLKRHAERIKKRMIAGMKEVLPDLLVGVTYAATDRWRKGAEAVFDDE